MKPLEFVADAGRKYLKFARRELATLSTLRRDIKLPTMQKQFLISGSHIWLKSSEFGDVIRITGGAQFALSTLRTAAGTSTRVRTWDRKWTLLGDSTITHAATVGYTPFIGQDGVVGLAVSFTDTGDFRHFDLAEVRVDSAGNLGAVSSATNIDVSLKDGNDVNLLVGGKAAQWGFAGTVWDAGFTVEEGFYVTRVDIGSPPPAPQQVTPAAGSPVVLGTAGAQSTILLPPWDSDNQGVANESYIDFSIPYNTNFAAEMAWAKYDALGNLIGTAAIDTFTTTVLDDGAANPFFYAAPGGFWISGDGSTIMHSKGVLLNWRLDASPFANFIDADGVVTTFTVKSGTITFTALATIHNVNRTTIAPSYFSVISAGYVGDSLVAQSSLDLAVWLLKVGGNLLVDINDVDMLTFNRLVVTDDDQQVVAFVNGGSSADAYWYIKEGSAWTRVGPQTIDVVGGSAFGLQVNHKTGAVHSHVIDEFSPKKDEIYLPVKDPNTGVWSVTLEQSPTTTPFGAGAAGQTRAEVFASYLV